MPPITLDGWVLGFATRIDSCSHVELQEHLIFANPHRRIDGWIRANPGRVDFITGLLYTLLCMPAALGLASSTSSPVSFAAVLMLSVIQSAPLMLRRRYPWAVTLVVAAGHLLQLAFDGLILFSQVSVPILVYTMAVYGKRWQSFSTLGLGLLGALLATFSMFGASRYSPDPTPAFTFDMMISFVGLALVVTLSWNLR